MRRLLSPIFALGWALGWYPGPGVFAVQSATAPATSQQATTQGSRIIKSFDFEETKLGNFESLPMYWSKVADRGFPAYSGGRFDHAVFRSADTSFLLETNGGSVAYRYAPPPAGKIPVSLSADYYILAFTRTANLQHARADITAWFADETGKLLPSTETHCRPYVDSVPLKDAKGDEWSVLYIHMPGPGENTVAEAGRAKSLVLEVGLLQPQQLAPGTAPNGKAGGLGRFEIYQQDIKGSAWFDDIVIFQLPRIQVAVPPQVTGAIFAPQQKIDLDLVVSDLGRGPGPNSLNVNLKITDPDGLVYASERWNAATTPEKAWVQRYSHAALPAGLYTATLQVTEADAAATRNAAVPQGLGTLVSSRQTRFLCLPAESGPPSRPAPEFGLGAVQYEDFRDLPIYLRLSGAGLIQIAAWQRSLTEEMFARPDPAFDQFISSLQRLNVQSIASFAELPDALTIRLKSPDARSILALLDADPKVWKPYFSMLLTRYGNRIDHWELGAPGTSFSGGSAATGRNSRDAERYPKLYAKALGEISSLLNRPQLIIPWNALFDFDAKLFPNATLDLALPSMIKPSSIPAYVQNFREVSATRPTPILAHLEPLQESQYSRADRLTDFAQRVVYARTANPQGILFDLPSTRNIVQKGPDELFLVYRALIRALADTSYVGELPIAPGVRGFLFDRQGSGTLVLWNESGGSAVVPLKLPLGPAPRLSDLLGNSQLIDVDPFTSLSRIQATAAPVILDQIDPRPLRLRCSFAMAQSAFPAGAGVFKTEVMLFNPYSDTLNGTLHLNPPAGWSTDPSSIPVTLAPQATLHQLVTFRYPFNETAGPKKISARLAMDAASGSGIRVFDLECPISVTSDLVQVEGFTQLMANGDLVVQETITNISNAPISAQAYALVPGYQRQTRFLQGLMPGQTVVKRFIFPASAFAGTAEQATPAQIAQALSNQSATLGLRQADGKTLITKSVPLD